MNFGFLDFSWVSLLLHNFSYEFGDVHLFEKNHLGNVVCTFVNFVPKSSW